MWGQCRDSEREMRGSIPECLISLSVKPETVCLIGFLFSKYDNHGREDVAGTIDRGIVLRVGVLASRLFIYVSRREHL